MKTKLLLLISLFTWAFNASAENDKPITHTEKVKIILSDDSENATKQIFVNGKELTPEEVKEFETSGKMKGLHMDRDKHGKHEKVVKVIKLNGEKTDREEDVQVFVTKENGKVTKKIIVDGKELSEDEIREFEKSGKMKGLHMEHAKTKGHRIIKVNGSSVEGKDNHVKIIKKHVGDGKHMKWNSDDGENIEVSIEKDGDKIIEKITMNGKELSAEEIKEFKASGKLKRIDIVSDMVVLDGDKHVFINADAEHKGNFDIEVIMDKIDGLHEIDESMIQEWVSDDGKNIKMIKKGFVSADDSASLGFMANVEDDGWHLTKIMEKSGAKDAGIMVGDVVTKIGDVVMARNPDGEKHEFSNLKKFKDGDIVKVTLTRDGAPITFDVQARKIDKSEILIELKSDDQGNFDWVEEFHSDGGIASNIKVMVFDGEKGDFKLKEDDIHMVFPDKFDKMNFFTVDGSSTSKLLGKHHEMSALSDGMAKYFNTKGGVLVLHVDEANAFDLKDGDVIKSINGDKVNSPKDVVKQLVKAKDEKKIKLKVIRHKKSKTLKYNK